MIAAKDIFVTIIRATTTLIQFDSKNEMYKDTGVLGILIGFWDLGRFYPLSGT